MGQILLENHVRKRARLVKDGKFGKFYEKYKNLIDNANTLEEFVDTIAFNYDPTFVSATATTGSEYLDYIIDNLERNTIGFSDQDAKLTKGLLSDYREECTAKEPRVQKELQRYYRDIVPTLKNAIADIKKVNTDKILNDADFIKFHDVVRQRMVAQQNKVAFLNTIKDDFDPTPDGMYLQYIINNLVPKPNTPANINLDDAATVKHLLSAHLAAVKENNPKVKRDIARYYPRIVPDLQQAMEAFAPEHDFKNNKHANLVVSETKFDNALGKPIYKTDEHLFYYVEDIKHGKLVMAQLGGNDYPAMKNHCSGYWCLPSMAQYYPAWLTLNRFGYNDYAIVPNAYEGELKNRFNSADTCIVMKDEDYESILSFIIDAEGRAKQDIYRTFSKPFNTGYMSDYNKFLMRSKNLDVVNILTGKSFSSIAEFLIWAFNIGNASDLVTFKNKAVSASYVIHSNFIAGNKNPQYFPLLQSFIGKASGVITGTELDSTHISEALLKAVIERLKKLVNTFAQNKELCLTDEAIKGNKDSTYLGTLIDSFAKGSFLSLWKDSPEKAKKIDEQFAAKIDDGTLRFDKPVNVSMLNWIMGEIKFLGGQLNNSKTYKALADSFSLYLKTGGISNLETTGKIDVSTFLSYLKMFIDVRLPAALAQKIAKVCADAYAADENHMTHLSVVMNTTKKYAEDLGITDKAFDLELMKSIDNILKNNFNKYSFAAVKEIYTYFKSMIEASPRKLNELFPNLMRRIVFSVPKTILSRLYGDIVQFSAEYVSTINREKLFNKIVGTAGTTVGAPVDATVDNADGTTKSAIRIAQRGYITVPCKDMTPVVELFRLGLNDGSLHSPEYNRLVETINTLINVAKFKVTKLMFQPFSGVEIKDTAGANAYYKNTKTMRILRFTIFGVVNKKTIAIDNAAAITSWFETPPGMVPHIYISEFVRRYKEEKDKEDPFAEQAELIRYRAIDTLIEQAFD